MDLPTASEIPCAFANSMGRFSQDMQDFSRFLFFHEMSSKFPTRGDLFKIISNMLNKGYV